MDSKRILITVLIGLIFICRAGAARRQTALLASNPRETNVLNFVRLLVMRLVYGVASVMGFEDGISDFANGALIPPGADEYGGTEDYDRDYYDY